MSRLRQGFGAQGLLMSWLASPPPDTAIEITPGRVSAAALAARGGRRLQAYAAEALPSGAVVPALASQNIHDRAAVAAAVRVALGRLGTRSARVALIIPDVAARVSVVRFEQVPSRRDDLDQLVRWQVRKSAPFPVDEACVTYTPGWRGPDGTEFVVVMARRDVVTEYEMACVDGGVEPGLVDLATLSVLNLVLASSGSAAGLSRRSAGTVREGGPSSQPWPVGSPSDPTLKAEDWLVVHMRPEYTSIAILRDGELIFFRNRPEGDEEPLTDVVHQTAMYYQDRLSGQGFARALLGGSGRTAGAVDQARRALEERLGTVVEPIDPTTAVALPDRITVSSDVMDVLAPLTGILLRTHPEAVSA